MIFKVLALWRRLEAASAESGKSVPTLIREIRALRAGPAFLSASEYLDYCIHLRSAEEQAAFLGAWWEGALNYMVDSPFWFATIRDKLLFHNVFAALGYRTAPIAFCFTRSGRTVWQGDSVDSAAALADRLRRAAFPLYAKPSGADVGLGGYMIAGHDAGDDTLDLVGRGREPVAAFCERIAGTVYGGYLFQPVLTNNAAMATWAGERLCTLRLNIFRGREEAWVHRAFLKLRCGDNHNDNWSHGKLGNVLVTIDESTGKMVDVIGGTISNPAHGSAHPDSGTGLSGRYLDGYPEARDLALAASAELPGMSILHWDIALTQGGPVLLEANEDGSLAALQGCGRRGFADERFRAFMREFGHDFTTAATQGYARDIGAIVERLFGVDNALMGRGTLYAPRVRME